MIVYYNREKVKEGLEYFLRRKLEEMPNSEKKEKLHDVFGFEELEKRNQNELAFYPVNLFE